MELLPFLADLSVATKQGGTIRFDKPWPAQRRLFFEVEKAAHEHRPCRLITLKARQMGVSTATEAVLFAKSICFPNTNGVVAAHDLESTVQLFGYTKLMYESYPARHRFPTRYRSQNRLTYKNTGSGVYVVTAARKTAGRGRTIHHLHASELAFWPHAEETWTSFRNAVPDQPGSIIVIESTANGIGNLFEQVWTEAQGGRNEYTPLFFPWFDHHEYVPCGGRGCEDATCEVCQLAGAGIQPRDEDEKTLVRLGCNQARLAWRRGAIQNKTFGNVDLFRQEYPSTPEEAFLASGINAFPEPHLQACWEALPVARGKLAPHPNRLGEAEWSGDPQGPIRMYRKPGRGQTYLVGADPCFGVGPDLAAAQVINRSTLEQVATFHARLNPIAFAEECARLAAFYNNAVVAGEANGPGQAFMAKLTHIYPHIWTQVYADRMPGRDRSVHLAGFATTWRSKAWLVSHLGNLLERRQVVLHDRPTYDELRSYVFYGAQDSFGPSAESGHDDLVMSLGIACLASSTEPVVEDEEVGPARMFGRVAGVETIWGEQESEEAWQ